MPENWRQSEICIVINDKSQDSTATHLSYDGLLHYKFITQFAREKKFKIGEHLAKLQGKRLIVSHAPIARLLSSKMQPPPKTDNSPKTAANLCSKSFFRPGQ